MLGAVLGFSLMLAQAFFYNAMSAAPMIGAAMVAYRLAVAAERKALEDIAPPLSL